MIKARLKRFISVLLENIKRPEMRILPGQLAFFFFLTLIPLVALIGSIFTQLHISSEFINEVMTNYFPDAVTALITSILSSNIHINTIVFLISALILASNGTYSMIITSNTIYKFSDKDYIYMRIKSLFMLFILIILLIFLLLIPTFGDMAFNFLVNINPLSNVKSIILFCYKLIKLPLSFFFIFLLIKLLYTMAPDSRISSKYVNYGAIFTSITWIIVTKAYSTYLAMFPGMETFYGGISNIIVLLWWLYFLSYVFVLGMSLNASYYNFTKK